MSAWDAPPADWPKLAGSRDRRLAAPTFAPDGLYLVGVEYASEWGIATAGAYHGAIRNVLLI